MPTTHPTVKTYEEFCKHYEQESELGKRRLFDTYQVAVKFLEARRRRERNRYAERKMEKCSDPAPAPVPDPAPIPVLISAPASVPLPVIQEEEVVVPVKVKRNSFTIPIPATGSLIQHLPITQFPTLVANTKTKRLPKTVS